MCPICITAAALTAAGTSSGVGAIAILAAKWRALRRRARGATAHTLDNEETGDNEESGHG